MIISVAQAQLFFFAFTRVMAILVHIPNLGSQSIPAQVRIAFGVMLTAVIAPLQPAVSTTEELGLFGLAAGLLRELIIGTIAGYSALLVFGVVQVAGEAMSLGSGFASSRIFNPAMEMAGSPFDQFFAMVALLLFFIIDGHHYALYALQQTFQIVPLGSSQAVLHIGSLLTLTGQLILAGVQMALPVLGSLLLADLALGLLARVAPQVQVYFLGLPVKVGISLLALSLALVVLFPRLIDLFRHIGDWMIALLQGA